MPRKLDLVMPMSPRRLPAPRRARETANAASDRSRFDLPIAIGQQIIDRVDAAADVDDACILRQARTRNELNRPTRMLLNQLTPFSDLVVDLLQCFLDCICPPDRDVPRCAANRLVDNCRGELDHAVKKRWPARSCSSCVAVRGQA
jgi:hypothetical protein